MTQHATGTFEVKLARQEQAPGPEGGLPTARFRLDKTFSGELTGRAVGVMLSVGAPKPGTAGSYVALDQFVGTLSGRQGAFVLVHRGVMSKAGVADLDVRIATDSGTGELTGIAGSLKIEVREGQHYYDLDYTLPAD